MKIGNFEFNFGRVQNVQKQEPVGNVLNKIVRTQLLRSRSEIKDWTAATTIAESLTFPNRAQLIKIYNDISIDSHLTSVMNTLKLKILSANWKVFSGKDVDEVATERLNSQFFREILSAFVESEFYGFTLVQLNDVVDGKSTVELVPREYVIPERRIVKKSLTALNDVINIDEPPFDDWLILADSGNLGLLHKAAPLIIMKKNVVSAWSEYAEIFGLPIRIGRTDIRDPRKYKNMDDMLSKMGSASYGVFDPSDDIQFIETSKGDAFQVFAEFAKEIDQQISKLILGQTGTTDEKSFAGSANVHAGVLADIVESYVQKMTFFVNDVVFPKLKKHGIVKENHVFGIQGENAVSKTLSQLSPMVANKILDSMQPNEIRALVSLPPDDTIVKNTTTEPVSNAVNESVMKTVSKLYADILHDCETHGH